MQTLAERLIKAREEKGWRKSDLMRAAKLKSPSTLTELESGKRTESPQLPIIAEALGVEVIWLQHGRGPMRPIKGTGQNTLNDIAAGKPPAAPTELDRRRTDKLPKHIAELIELANSMSTEGQFALLGRAQELAIRYPAKRKQEL